ncbi:hypothetical protein [Corallococcus sp. CA031C]|uniref:hypothetical protein n=1 Tax=Corallococcus sp. CA031C TaxID=2316725 RepID=UPI0011C3B9A2|nr:hypothetical protein [Corallococcus sp. CA031C]
MGFTASGLWLILVAAAGTPSDPSAEALCGLTALYTIERSYFGEKDRYDLHPATVGFLPLSCIDGTRPTAPESNSVGGCRFLFTILEAGGIPDAPLKLEARGVTPDTQDLRFLLEGRNGFITRPGSDARVDPADCEAWSREADPLQRYRFIVGEHDCIGGPYAPTHPCTEALTLLSNLARDGVGMARMEYDAHPTARELFPLSPPTPTQLLCGVTATPGQRAQLAQSLSRQGLLLDAVLAPGCRDEGLRAGLPVLLRAGACPGNRCTRLMTLARTSGTPERLAVLEGRASALASWLWNQPATEQREFLVNALALPGGRVDALLRLREGSRPGLQELNAPPPGPLESAWLERARTAHPGLAPFLDLLGELHHRRPASDAAFRDWLSTAPCDQLSMTQALKPTVARLRAIASIQPRCAYEAVQALRPHVAKLPPTALIDVLTPLSAEQLLWLQSNLGLTDAARAEALFDWVMEREPRLLDGFVASPSVVERLLAPVNADRLGGREAVLEVLLGRMHTPRISLTPFAFNFVVTESLRGTPSALRVRDISERYIPAEEKLRFLSGVLRSTDARAQAAAAAGLTKTTDARVPAPAARACLEETRATLACIASHAEPLGPPPPGERRFIFGGCGVGPQPPPTPPSPIETYCTRLEEKTASCPTACGGTLLDASGIERLASAAGEPPPPIPQALRACTHVLP